MSNLTKYLGIHAPEGAAYATGLLDAWYGAFGATPEDSRGAPISWKRRDSVGMWQGGLAAGIPTDKELMLAEAKPWWPRIYSQWITHTDANPLDEDTWSGTLERNLLAAARAVGALYPGRLMWNNRRGGDSGASSGNSRVSTAFYGYLSGRVGKVWQEMGREWGYVDDNGPASTVQDLAVLAREWKSVGAKPSFIAHHAYGIDHWHAQHSTLIRAGVNKHLGRDVGIVHGEAHVWFVPDGDTRNQHPYIFNEQAGSWCAMMAEANHAAGIETCHFTADMFFSDAAFTWEESLSALVEKATTGEFVAPPYTASVNNMALKSFAIRRGYLGYPLAWLLTQALR